MSTHYTTKQDLIWLNKPKWKSNFNLLYALQSTELIFPQPNHDIRKEIPYEYFTQSIAEIIKELRTPTVIKLTL